MDAQLTRHYPYGHELGHVLGYVGRLSADDLKELDQSRYQGTLHTGKVGLEKRYEALLHGKPGFRHVETNAHGRVLRVLERQSPEPGQDLALYLDLDLQREAVAALGEQRGAVVVLDPSTGGVLAMVSNPSYDPNLFVNGISYADYAQLRDSMDTPLLNRALQGQYPPGSTIKPMLALGALAEGYVTPETTVADPGWYQLPGDDRRYRDWTLRVRGSGHAEKVDLRMAIAESCDTYYYDLANRMGIDTMAEVLAPLGWVRSPGLIRPESSKESCPTPSGNEMHWEKPGFPARRLAPVLARVTCWRRPCSSRKRQW